ncbi:uncharacterized protein CEXT_318971 [Caerostris extrusa]|uniref:Uncharacterized protein n=1 Tax=Caerostris extrusa TaxID=172846 RepID=A0AAV4N9K9_CAEEX|nr:uncharacterized protein CEXT_318971 [Caerostris extrusa]
MFDKLQNDMRSNKIGFTKITNAAGKNLQCFPKIIFKTIDGNPHAVFQSRENNKSESITLQNKLNKTIVPNKPENEKLIIVLKKEANASITTDAKQIPEKTVKTCKDQNEFHLTRRKRLLARNDCNVQELKCLTCKNPVYITKNTLFSYVVNTF